MNLAYIDPGTGSMLISTIMGGIAAVGVFVKMYWKRLLVLLRLRKPDEPRTPRPAGESASYERAREPVGKP